MTPAELLREAANRVDTAVQDAAAAGHHYAGVTQLGDEWAALLTPHVAAPLAAWLRAEAVIAEFDDNLRYNLSLNLSPEAVAFARSILQEEP